MEPAHSYVMYSQFMTGLRTAGTSSQGLAEALALRRYHLSLFLEERDLALAYAYVVLGSAVAQVCVLTCTCPALCGWATNSCRGPLPATAQAAEPVV